MSICGYFPSRCCLYNNHQAKDYIDSFVTHCVRVSVHSNYIECIHIWVLSRLNLPLKMKPVILDNWCEGRIGKLGHLKMVILRKSENVGFFLFFFLLLPVLYYISRSFTNTFINIWCYKKSSPTTSSQGSFIPQKMRSKKRIIFTFSLVKKSEDSLYCNDKARKYQEISEDIFLTLKSCPTSSLLWSHSSKTNLLLTYIQRSGHLHCSRLLACLLACRLPRESEGPSLLMIDV